MATMESTATSTSMDNDSKTHSIHASLNYYSLNSSPQVDDISIFNGTSADFVGCDAPITDLRHTGKPLSSYNHETHGFSILSQPLPIDPSPGSVHDAAVMNSQYYPAIGSLLKESFGLRSAVVINHTLRDTTSTKDSHVDPKNPRPLGKSLAPFFLVHSDYTPAAARAHFRAMTPDWFKETKTEVGTTEEERQDFFRLRDEIISAENDAMTRAGIEAGHGDIVNGGGGHWEWDGRDYKGPRYAMFSVWRPWQTVQRDPLAVMDGSNFPYVVLPRSYRSRPGCVPQYYNENVLVKPPGAEDKHNWYYISEQKPEEVLAIKFYDSDALGQGSETRLMCPHTAFHTEEMDNQPVRRSCELRVWCIW